MSSVTLRRRRKFQRRRTQTPTLGTKEEKDEEERGGHFHHRIVGLFWVVVFWSIFKWRPHSMQRKNMSDFVLAWFDSSQLYEIVFFVGIGRAVSRTLTSLFCVRKNEFEHSRHSGDKCLPEYDVRANEDSVRISRKHRGTKTVSTGVSICSSLWVAVM